MNRYCVVEWYCWDGDSINAVFGPFDDRASAERAMSDLEGLNGADVIGFEVYEMKDHEEVSSLLIDPRESAMNGWDGEGPQPKF
jgi:hypothetical protein